MRTLILTATCLLVASQGQKTGSVFSQVYQAQQRTLDEYKSLAALLHSLGAASAFQAPSISTHQRARSRLSQSPVVMQEYSEKITSIIELMKGLTMLEAAELTKAIEETFDVDASAGGGGMMMPMAMPAAGGADAGGAAADEDAQTEFTVILEAPPADKKIGILKVVRQLTEMGLMDAKKFVESAPKPLKENVSKEQAADIQKQIEDAGGKVTLK